MLPWLGALRPLIEPFTQFRKCKDYLVGVAQKLRDARRKEKGSTNKVRVYLHVHNIIMYNILCACSHFHHMYVYTHTECMMYMCISMHALCHV